LDSEIRASAKAIEVVCIIPTLNESSTVVEVVKSARQYAHRVVVVDGHSDDGTYEAAQKAGADVILQDGKGKGMALRTIFDKVIADIYVIIDGDATYNAQEMGNILQPILEGEADMVIGSRLQGKMEERSITRTNKAGNRLFNYLINSLFNGEITDSQSGYRALNRKTIECLNLKSKGFEVETEITINALKRGLTIREVPITYVRRRGSLSKLNSVTAGSKILWMIIRSI
jgi:glycosyltransferase involved in cell wall biosynthesis